MLNDDNGLIDFARQNGSVAHAEHGRRIEENDVVTELQFRDQSDIRCEFRMPTASAGRMPLGRSERFSTESGGSTSSSGISVVR